MKFPNTVIVVPAVLLVRSHGHAGFEVGEVDVSGEQGDDALALARRDDDSTPVVGVERFEDGRRVTGECLEVFEIAAGASADLGFIRLCPRASYRIETVLGEEPHVSEWG